MSNFFSHVDYKQNGPQILKDEATNIALVKNPAKADTFAAFTAKIIASVGIVPADITFTPVGETLQVTVAGENGLDPNQTAAIGDALGVAVYSTVTEKVYICQGAVSRVITNETSDTVNIPNFVHTIQEFAQA